MRLQICFLKLSSNECQYVVGPPLLQDFASILTDYKLTQKLAAEREASCLPRQPPPTSHNTRSAAAAAASDLEAQTPSQGGGGEEGYERQALLQATQQRDSSRMDGAIAYNEALIEERDVGIADIQRQIAEVGAVGAGGRCGCARSGFAVGSGLHVVLSAMHDVSSLGLSGLLVAVGGC